MNVEQIAEVCHEANRAYCATIGDAFQPAWLDAPAWQKDSARKGVEFHLEELAAGGTPKPEASHENWLKEKVADGWVYGEKKDPEAKTHPCCVPYQDLSRDQQRKDYIFIAIVKAFYKTATINE
jgi:hypothetical protein